MNSKQRVLVLAAGTAVVGTLIPALTSASSGDPSVVGCSADGPPPTTVYDGPWEPVTTAPAGDGVESVPTTEAVVDVAPTTEAVVDVAPTTEAVVDVAPTTEAVVESSSRTASGWRSSRQPAADPITKKYELTVVVTMPKDKSKIDKWAFTPFGNPCRLTGVSLSIGVGGEPGSYYEYYTLVITDPALDKDKCRPLIYPNGSSTALTGVTRIEANPNFTAIFKFDRKAATEVEFRIVIECT